MNNAIGGFFGLELLGENDLFSSEKGFVGLNSGRNCLEYILKVRNYHFLYLPYFTCEVILEPLKKLEIPFEFYDIDDNLEPIFDYTKITSNQGFLYTNYFGTKDKFIAQVSAKIPNLIIDNAQSLFSKPLENIDTFYSPRKFVGVADGGFLSINKKLNDDFEQDVSYNRMSHLLKRIDLSPEEAYADFSINDESLTHQEIKFISKLTSKILSGIDFELIKKRRKENFTFLHDALKNKNLLTFDIDEDSIPMVYPFRTKDVQLKEKLINEKIYCATYWQNVLKWAEKDKNSYKLTQEIIALPIDQRYSILHMEQIVNKITIIN